MDQQDKSGARFSKGPWEVVDHPTYPSFRGVRGPSFNVSAVMQATDLTFADYLQRDADLHLIAAAPELYEALRAYVAYTEDGIADGVAGAREIECLETASAALAKATGSQQ